MHHLRHRRLLGCADSPDDDGIARDLASSGLQPKAWAKACRLLIGPRMRQRPGKCWLAGLVDQRLGAVLGAPDHGIGHEEALLGHGSTDRASGVPVRLGGAVTGLSAPDGKERQISGRR